MRDMQLIQRILKDSGKGKKDSTWSELEVLEELGSGSYGTVYKVKLPESAGGGYEAMKVTMIPQNDSELEERRAEGMTQDETFAYYERMVKDYAAEIQLMKAVSDCKNTVTLKDFKIMKLPRETVWCVFIRMELLTPLLKKVALDGGLKEKEIIRLGTDLCTALDICRRKNIVHRDIKPENIFVDDQGDYKLGDFGVARKLENMTLGFSKKGTPNYMAPEVYTASLKETDFSAAAKVDIYSLGMVLYWLSNGSRLPFLSLSKQISTSADRQRALDRRMRGEPLPPPANASPALQEIILKACAYRPQDRYQGADEMLGALWALGKKSYSQRSPKPAPQPAEPKPERRHDDEGTIALNRQRSGEPGKSQPRPQSGSPRYDDEGTIALNRHPSGTQGRAASVSGSGIKEPFDGESTVALDRNSRKRDDPYSQGNRGMENWNNYPYEDPFPAADTKPEKEKPRKKTGLIIAIVLIVAAAALAGVFLFLHNGDQDEGDKNDASPAPTATARATETPAPAQTSPPTAPPPTATPEPEKKENVPSTGVQGDVNGSGDVSVMDVIHLQKFISGWDVDVNHKQSDVTGDGAVNVNDVIRLQKMISGWDLN